MFTSFVAGNWAPHCSHYFISHAGNSFADMLIFTSILINFWRSQKPHPVIIENRGALRTKHMKITEFTDACMTGETPSIILKTSVNVPIFNLYFLL